MELGRRASAQSIVEYERDRDMKNILLSVAVATALLVGILATPTTAEARPRGYYGGRASYGYGYRPYYYGNYAYRPYYGGYRNYSYYPRYNTNYRGYGYGYPSYYGGYGYGYGYPRYYGGYGYPGYYGGYGTGFGVGGLRGGVYVY